MSGSRNGITAAIVQPCLGVHNAYFNKNHSGRSSSNSDSSNGNSSDSSNYSIIEVTAVVYEYSIVVGVVRTCPVGSPIGCRDGCQGTQADWRQKQMKEKDERKS